MTSFIGYIDDEMIKLTIYFNSQKRIDEQITNIIPLWIHVFIQDRGAYKHKNVRIMCLPIFFRNKYLKQPSIDIDFCKLTSSRDVVYKVRWWR